ncbi:unnamed protein product [Miscanthus lutarioriparius]|uniref:BZIP domain-containing protein n=1 Tax=Miscanthus lutarioriparius TaxID=422564 RepID=A0A811PW56_9POAL|nr:unnamed protein product [Miscanthus lutarioriparius]
MNNEEYSRRYGQAARRRSLAASLQDQPPATTSSGTASVYPEWPSFQAYSAIPPHGFFPPTVAANPQAHPYMWGAQPMVPPYGTPPPPYVMYPPGTVYAHPSTPPTMHPFSHYPMPTNGHAETSGAAPSAPEMNVRVEVRVRVKEVMPILKMIHTQKDNDGKEDGNSQNGISYSASQGMLNQTMAMLPVQPGAMVGGVPSSTANLNIGMDYWAAPGSAAVLQHMAKHQLENLFTTSCVCIMAIFRMKGNSRSKKRKQSNRESARRSRLRKQAECEELGQRAEALRSENSLSGPSLSGSERSMNSYFHRMLPSSCWPQFSVGMVFAGKAGATSDSIPDMNEKNDGDGSYKKQPDSDAQS